LTLTSLIRSFFSSSPHPPPLSTLFPYTPLFRSILNHVDEASPETALLSRHNQIARLVVRHPVHRVGGTPRPILWGEYEEDRFGLELEDLAKETICPRASLRDRTATSFKSRTRVNRERKTLNSLEPFKLRCIDHIVPVFPSHSLFFFVDVRLQLSSSADPLFRYN